MVAAAFSLDDDDEDDDLQEEIDFNQNDSNGSMTTLYPEEGGAQEQESRQVAQENHHYSQFGFEMTREDFKNHDASSSSSSSASFNFGTSSSSATTTTAKPEQAAAPTTKVIMDRIKERLAILPTALAALPRPRWTTTTTNRNERTMSSSAVESTQSNNVSQSSSSSPPPPPPPAASSATPATMEQKNKSRLAASLVFVERYQTKVAAWRSNVVGGKSAYTNTTTSSNMWSDAATQAAAAAAITTTTTTTAITPLPGNELVHAGVPTAAHSPPQSANANATPAGAAPARSERNAGHSGSTISSSSSSSDGRASPDSSPRGRISGVRSVDPFRARKQKPRMSTGQVTSRSTVSNSSRRPAHQRPSQTHHIYYGNERQQQQPRLPALLVLAGWERSSYSGGVSRRRVPALLVLSGWTNNGYSGDGNHDVDKEPRQAPFSAWRHAPRIIMNHVDDSPSIDAVLFETETSSSMAVRPDTATRATSTIGATTSSLPDSLFVETAPQTRAAESNKLPALLRLAGWGKSESPSTSTYLYHKQDANTDDKSSGSDDTTMPSNQDKKIFMNFKAWMETVTASLGLHGKRDTTSSQQDLDPSVASFNQLHMNCWKYQNDPRAFVALDATDKPAFRHGARVTLNRQHEIGGRMNRKPRQRLPPAARKQHRGTSTPRRSTALAAMPTIHENDEVSLETV
jgi:hypothetical protein